MNRWWSFSALLTQKGWLKPGFVQTDAQGIIMQITDQKPENGVDTVVKGYATPSFTNGHSHAFQFAMAGFAEYRPFGIEKDDFWSWREAMYEVALKINPDQMEVIATALYSELVKQGYSWVVEFHYLHHDISGKPYNNKILMAERLIHAAQKVGIGITLVPVYYNKGGFKKSATPQQRRFLFPSVNEYFQYMQDLQKLKNIYKKLKIGYGVHSLRAADSQDVIEIFKNSPSECPKHIHAAEQVGEVVDCKESLGQRPVEWLLNHIELNSTFNLIHATHMERFEWERLIKSGAQVVLCPSTEGNLGDGFFPLSDFYKQGGHWTIGTDSHIGLNPLEELRWADYIQRLTIRRRNPLCLKEGDESGKILYSESIRTGYKSSGRNSTLAKGDFLDVLVIDESKVHLKHLFSQLIFSSDKSLLNGVILNGKWIDLHQENDMKYKQELRTLVQQLFVEE